MCSARGIHDGERLNAHSQPSHPGRPGEPAEGLRSDRRNVAEHSGDDRAGRWGFPARDPGLGEVGSSNLTAWSGSVASIGLCSLTGRSSRPGAVLPSASAWPGTCRAGIRSARTPSPRPASAPAARVTCSATPACAPTPTCPPSRTASRLGRGPRPRAWVQETPGCPSRAVYTP